MGTIPQLKGHILTALSLARRTELLLYMFFTVVVHVLQALKTYAETSISNQSVLALHGKSPKSAQRLQLLLCCVPSAPPKPGYHNVPALHATRASKQPPISISLFCDAKSTRIFDSSNLPDIFPGLVALVAQNTEMEIMRSSMDEMRAIIQIQAQIDAFLVEGGEEGLLSARLEAMARGEPDPRLVRQAIKLLCMRQRLLQVSGEGRT